jgi:hypothetical protein
LRCAVVAATPLLVVRASCASLRHARLGRAGARVQSIFRRIPRKSSNWKKFAKFDEMSAERPVALFYNFVTPAQGAYQPQTPAGRGAGGGHMRISA